MKQNVCYLCGVGGVPDRPEAKMLVCGKCFANEGKTRYKILGLKPAEAVNNLMLLGWKRERCQRAIRYEVEVGNVKLDKKMRFVDTRPPVANVFEQ